jgi:urease accessory protein
VTGHWANRAEAGAGAGPGRTPDEPRRELPERTGRDGLMRLTFERRGARTVLTERRFHLPLQVMEPLDLDGGLTATVMMLNPTGGVCGGDRLETDVRLGPGSRVCLATPAATRVYRSSGSPATLTFAAVLGEQAVLEYVPDHLIPSPGARLRQRTAVRLEAGAVAMILDAFAVGRIARGERWRFAELDLALEVSDADGPLLADRAILGGRPRTTGGEEPWPEGPGGAGGFGYVATFAAVAPGRSGWGALQSALAAALSAELGGAGRFGVSALARGGLVARLLLPGAPALEAAVGVLRATCRRHLLDQPPLWLRKT